MHRFWQDVRARFRRLLKTPGSAIAAILLLAIGISINSTFFSSVDGFLRRVKKSGRRCAVCFGLDGAGRVKSAAFLCVPRHDDHDSVSQHTKRLTAADLKGYRDQLYEALVCD